MARKNNYFRRQPEPKVITIRESEFKIRKVERTPFGNELKITLANGTKCVLFDMDYVPYQWELLQDYLSEKDSVIVRQQASKIIEAYIVVEKSYHILKDIKYDEKQVGYYFFFGDEKGDPTIEVFLRWDNFLIQEFFLWDGELKKKPRVEELKAEFVGQKAVLMWIGKRPVKIACFSK